MQLKQQETFSAFRSTWCILTYHNLACVSEELQPAGDTGFELDGCTQHLNHPNMKHLKICFLILQHYHFKSTVAQIDLQNFTAFMKPCCINKCSD